MEYGLKIFNENNIEMAYSLSPLSLIGCYRFYNCQPGTYHFVLPTITSGEYIYTFGSTTMPPRQSIKLTDLPKGKVGLKNISFSGNTMILNLISASSGSSEKSIIIWRCVSNEF